MSDAVKKVSELLKALGNSGATPEAKVEAAQEILGGKKPPRKKKTEGTLDRGETDESENTREG